MLELYAKCGLLSKAQVVFDQLSDQDGGVLDLIAGYVKHGFGEQALRNALPRKDGIGWCASECSHFHVFLKGMQYHRSCM